MRIFATVLILLIAALHFYIAWFEMFAWTSKGPAVFTSFAPEIFEPTTMMAANQGLYNAFLGIGLIWSRLIKDPKWSANVATCFLLFIVIAGVFGAATVSPRILVVQTAPAVVALLVLFLARPKSI